MTLHYNALLNNHIVQLNLNLDWDGGKKVDSHTTFRDPVSVARYEDKARWIELQPDWDDGRD
jgi:hypothetical protein